jgi:TolA-binding protein
MEFPLQSSPSWLHTALTSLVSLIAGGGIFKLWNTWLNRRKPAVETAEIAVRTTDAASMSVMRMMDRLERSQKDIDRLRGERNTWQQKAEQHEIELRLNEAQIKKMKGLLDVHGIKYSEFD